MGSPEPRARKSIDGLFDACGWSVQCRDQANLGDNLLSLFSSANNTNAHE